MSEILLSQLAHVELVSPKPEETVRWMVEVLGLEETTREGQSATGSMKDDIAFYKTLGQRHTAQIGAEPGFTVFATMRCNGVRSTHDLGLVPDFGATGRTNHIAYNVDQRLDVERAAEVFMAHDTPVEFGPGIHGCDEITYLYVREPGGFRIEINSGGWENAMPDWQATNWNTSQGGTTLWKNLAMPESMMEWFPAIAGDAAENATEGSRPTGLFVEK